MEFFIHHFRHQQCLWVRNCRWSLGGSQEFWNWSVKAPCLGGPWEEIYPGSKGSKFWLEFLSRYMFSPKSSQQGAQQKKKKKNKCTRPLLDAPSSRGPDNPSQLEHHYQPENHVAKWILLIRVVPLQKTFVTMMTKMVSLLPKSGWEMGLATLGIGGCWGPMPKVDCWFCCPLNFSNL